MSERKLSPKQQVQVCQWLGEMLSPTEIAKLIKKEWEIEITRETIALAYRDSEHWKPKIKEYYDAWRAGINNERLAHKRARIQFLDRVVLLAYQQENFKAVVSALAQIHKELEGNNINVTGSLTHNNMLASAIKKAKESESQG